MLLSAVIIDDEQNAREAIRSTLDLYCKNVNVTGEAGDVESAIKLIREKKPDVVLLDIEIKDKTGFDLLEQFPAPDFKVVFITAHNEFAVKAFKFSALDYVLKPLDPDELSQAIEKCREQINKLQFEKQLKLFSENFQKHNTEKIALKTEQSIHIVEIENIVQCESDRNYTTFYLSTKEKILVSRPLKEYDELFSGKNFFRVHQSHLINMKHIHRFDKQDGGFVIMKDGSSVPVASRKRAELIELFNRI
jgi:two-component system LytT family response regulator